MFCSSKSALAVLLLGCLGLTISAQEQKPEPLALRKGIWTLDKGFDKPESAYFEVTTNTIYVTNVVGAPDEKDGQGYLSKVSPDGKMLVEKWVTGLNAPKGPRAYKNTLYVSDIDTVVAIDLASGKILGRTPIAGAKLLNDIAIDSDGHVYVSDTFGNRVYVIKDGKPEVFLNEGEVSAPNGLLVHDQELVVASWGEEIEPGTWKVKAPGKLVMYDLKTKEKTELTKQPLGNLDGLENDGSGGYYVSDFMAGVVYHISSEGGAQPILGGFKNAADIGVIEGKTIILVPCMGENRVIAYDLEQL